MPLDKPNPLDLPRKGDRRYDKLGPIVCMAYADKHVMVRRPHCIPFVLELTKWEDLSTTPLPQGKVLRV